MRPQDRKAILKLPDDCHPGDTAVVVMSCSRFKQVWMPFFTLFRRYWPDCPYDVCFLTDIEKGGIPDAPWLHESVGTSGVPVIVYTQPTDLGWCGNFVRLMKNVREQRIILFQEDMLPTAPADTPVVRRLVRYAHQNDVGCLRLMPCPGPDRPWKNPFLGEIDKDADYRVSLQLAVWDRNLITDLVARTTTPWMLEGQGARLTRGFRQSFLSVHRESYEWPGGPVPYFITAVTRGKWEKGALELLRREGISMDGITERIP
jgi:hypothetical protein